jgi:glycine/D-amino acid oxidase-like deaminating enzyme
MVHIKIAAMRYGLRFWDARTPVAKRPSWPRWKPAKGTDGDTADVVIVGGGLTGCACAYALSAAGHRVVLLEASRMASGATAGSAGVLLPAFDGAFADHSALHGLRAARGMWQQARKGTLELAALIKRLGIRCDLDSTSAVTFARDARYLTRDYTARRTAGLDVTRVVSAALARETGLSGAAIRTPGVFTFDPVRAALGLAAHAAKRGARLFEHSPVTRVRHLPRGKGVQVRTAAGTITARAAVIATGAPGPLVSQLRRHFSTRDTYIVVTDSMPAAMRKAAGSRKTAMLDAEDPPHTVRWLKEDRAMIAGADQAPVASRLKERTLVQRTGQLMYELSLFYPELSGLPPAYAWDAPITTTADGAPFIGPHRNLPGHLFALGFGRHGDGLAWLAARAIVRHFEGEPSKDDALFEFSRQERR